jgi:hypothetical protein
MIFVTFPFQPSFDQIAFGRQPHIKLSTTPSGSTPLLAFLIILAKNQIPLLVARQLKQL